MLERTSVFLLIALSTQKTSVVPNGVELSPQSQGGHPRAADTSSESTTPLSSYSRCFHLDSVGPINWSQLSPLKGNQKSSPLEHLMIYKLVFLFVWEFCLLVWFCLVLFGFYEQSLAHTHRFDYFVRTSQSTETLCSCLLFTVSPCSAPLNVWSVSSHCAQCYVMLRIELSASCLLGNQPSNTRALSCSRGVRGHLESGPHYIVQACLQPKILLPQPSKC